MPDINNSQLCLTPFEETEKTAAKDKKELEASATTAEPVFWPPPYMQNPPPGDRGMDMYPFSSNYMDAGAGVPPHTVDVTNPQCQAGHKSNQKRIMPWLLVALGLLIVGCAGYQIGKRCGFWKGYRYGSDEYSRRRCRDDDGYWRYDSRYHDDDYRYHDRRHDRYEGGMFDWGHFDSDERYQFGGRTGGQSCQFRRMWGERLELMDVCTDGYEDRRMIEWDNRNQGYRYIQVVRDPPMENERPRIMEAIDSIIDNTQVCMIIVDGLQEIGSYFENFDQFMSELNGTMNSMNEMNEFDPTTAVNATFYMEPISDTDFLEEARGMLDGFCNEDSELRQLIREMDNHPRPMEQGCVEETTFVLPFNYQPPAIPILTNAVGMDLNLFNFCMQDRVYYKK